MFVDRNETSAFNAIAIVTCLFASSVYESFLLACVFRSKQKLSLKRQFNHRFHLFDYIFTERHFFKHTHKRVCFFGSTAFPPSVRLLGGCVHMSPRFFFSSAIIILRLRLLLFPCHYNSKNKYECDCNKTAYITKNNKKDIYKTKENERWQIRNQGKKMLFEQSERMSDWVSSALNKQTEKQKQIFEQNEIVRNFYMPI